MTMPTRDEIKRELELSERDFFRNQTLDAERELSFVEGKIKLAKKSLLF